MTFEEIRSHSVAFQKNFWSGISRHIPVGHSLDMIKNGTYKHEVARLRAYLKSRESFPVETSWKKR